MTEWIEIHASGRVTKLVGGVVSPATVDELDAIAHQMAADAVYGSFGEFKSDYWRDKWQITIQDLVKMEVRPEEDNRVLSFTLSVNPTLYDVAKGGLQHFLGVLAGDLFFLRVPNYTFENFHVIDVRMPTGFLETLISSYRTESHAVTGIRSAFKLEKMQPLLAFSFKPRVGLKPDAIREISLGVLGAGFHIVEFDTRYLDLRNDNVNFLISLAKEAAQVGGRDRITRLSPNLSVAAPIALDLCHRFSDTSEWPYVIKVDGGLDGLSTLQAIRSSFHNGLAPITTCYPLLREQLGSKIPQDTFVQALTLSGADIIYPGGSPSIGMGTRELGMSERNAVIHATSRYRKFVEQGWPMVTLAGGVYAGQLHSLFELVGPDVAYFLGGAVSLHRKGPIQGAELCYKILRDAADRHNKEAAKVKDLPGSLIEEIESAYEIPAGGDPNTFHYVSPKTLLATIEVTRW